MLELSTLLPKKTLVRRSTKQRFLERCDRRTARTKLIFDELAEAQQANAIDHHVDSNYVNSPIADLLSESTVACGLLGTTVLSPAQELLAI
jgi:hypothetical protein